MFVTGVICCGIDGTIIWVRHNCPGSWNDGEISRRLQHRLLDEKFLAPNKKICTDSAFPFRGDLAGKIITPIKEGDLERVPPHSRRGLQIMSDCVTSLRQATEWGMGSVGKVYRQLVLLPLPYDPQQRNLRLHNIFRMFNYRLRKTGISQIKNVFGA